MIWGIRHHSYLKQSVFKQNHFKLRLKNGLLLLML